MASFIKLSNGLQSIDWPKITNKKISENLYMVIKFIINNPLNKNINIYFIYLLNHSLKINPIIFIVLLDNFLGNKIEKAQRHFQKLLTNTD